MANKVIHQSPVGRLVMGNPLEEQTTDLKGLPMRNLKGEPKSQWFVGLAIPKAEAGEIWARLQEVAQAECPAGFQLPTFSWKVIDGDGIDGKGKQYNEREGYAGCYIFKFSTGYAPSVVAGSQLGALANAQLIQPNQIKKGDYLRVGYSISGNNDKTGIYVNLEMAELTYYGPAIISGPDAGAFFGGAPVTAAMPAGASVTPTAGGPMAAPAPGYPAPAAAPAPGYPAPAAAPAPGYPAPAAAPATAAYQPDPGFAANQAAPAPGYPAPAAAPAPGYPAPAAAPAPGYPAPAAAPAPGYPAPGYPAPAAAPAPGYPNAAGHPEVPY